MRPKKVLIVTCSLSLMALGGCATNGSDEIASLQQQLDQSQQENTTLMARVKTLESSISQISTASGRNERRADKAEYALASSLMLPEDAMIGQCFGLTDENVVEPTACSAEVSPGLIMSIQTALDKAGFSPGPIDGIIGSKTLAAVRAYQATKSLTGGGLTMETIKSLGVL